MTMSLVPRRVISGGVESTTTTSRKSGVAGFPAASLTLYDTLKEVNAGAFVSTRSPPMRMVSVRVSSSSRVSVAVAPGSM